MATTLLNVEVVVVVSLPLQTDRPTWQVFDILISLEPIKRQVTPSELEYA